MEISSDNTFRVKALNYPGRILRADSEGREALDLHPHGQARLGGGSRCRVTAVTGW